MKFLAALFLALALDAAAEPSTYRLIGAGPESARGTSAQVLQLLAAGEIDAVARLSNAPERRGEVLRDYRASVGEAEFRRIFAEYAARPIIAEVAIGERRLVIRDLDATPQHFAGQYFVREGNAFVIDDVPTAERAELARVLADYRAARIKP